MLSVIYTLYQYLLYESISLQVEFHEMTEGMNRNAQWWPILQICILLLTGIFQVKNLKKFFQQQKMLY